MPLCSIRLSPCGDLLEQLVRTILKSALVVPLAAVTMAASPQPGTTLQGYWRNPKGTVEVQIDACGISICGTVVSASPSAVADARDSGYPSLVGMQLLYGYHAAGPDEWRGTIFVPDIGRSFASHIELVDADHIRVSGCLIGKFLCKSQLWRRA
jgi:uncharacterized protein (DUF2147 family)